VITISLISEPIFVVPGEPWWAKVTGTITVDLTNGKGWIAPAKKK
jgi:hypothetical protein